MITKNFCHICMDLLKSIALFEYLQILLSVWLCKYFDILFKTPELYFGIDSYWYIKCSFILRYVLNTCTRISGYICKWTYWTNKYMHLLYHKYLKNVYTFSIFFNILFYSGVWLINIAVTLSGEQQRVSAIHIQVPISPQTPSEGVF